MRNGREKKEMMFMKRIATNSNIDPSGERGQGNRTTEKKTRDGDEMNVCLCNVFFFFFLPSSQCIFTLLFLFFPSYCLYIGFQILRRFFGSVSCRHRARRL